MKVLVLILLGLCFGSFANALAWRLYERRKLLERGKDKLDKKQQAELERLSIVHGRSECPHCHHVLAAKDLVPVASWMMLRGKCRYCKARIDDTPLPELATPLLFVGSYIWWPFALHGVGLFEFGLWLVFLVGFVALAVYDLRWFMLPNEMVFPLIALSVLQVLVVKFGYGGDWRMLVDSALGVLVVAGVFYALFLASNGGWIGGGDVKLGIVLGLLACGAIRGLVLLFIASVSGLLATIPMMLRGEAHRKSMIPFGPFLMLGLVIVVLFGTDIVNWYTQLFHA